MTAVQPEGFRPAAIIHLGAGHCRELDDYLATGAGRIVLVEANPAIVQVLHRRTSNLAHVEVIPTAVAETGGKALLTILNLPAFSSLRAPTGLRKLFPGLRPRGQVEVETTSPVDLIDAGRLDSDRENMLVIDVPGEEAVVLDVLRTSGRLDRFATIVLHCGKTALYEGGQDADVLLRALEKDGYDAVRIEDGTDPDRPGWVLRRNIHKIENQELRARVDELTRARDEQAKLAADRQARIDTLEATLPEMDERQRLLAEEMMRAEGQIDLIKDVLLREPGL